LWVIFALLDPDSEYGSGSTNLIESGFEALDFSPVSMPEYRLFVACVAEGGQAGHLVRLLELREERVKATEVSLVFTACTTLLTRVARSPEPHLGKFILLVFH
jgi:hypothetical protein